MTISRHSIIRIDPKRGIKVEENAGSVEIGGGRVILDYLNSFSELVEDIKDQEDFNITIIQGNFTGSFDEVVVLKPEDACEEVDVTLVQESEGRGIIGVFSLNDGKCSTSFPIWAIVVIVLGSIIVLVAVFLIMALLYKPLGKVIYPYRYRKR